MGKLMKTTAGESLVAAANIFIGQSEAPLMIRPFLPVMTNSGEFFSMTFPSLHDQLRWVIFPLRPTLVILNVRWVIINDLSFPSWPTRVIIFPLGPTLVILNVLSAFPPLHGQLRWVILYVLSFPFMTNSGESFSMTFPSPSWPTQVSHSQWPFPPLHDQLRSVIFNDLSLPIITNYSESFSCYDKLKAFSMTFLTLLITNLCKSFLFKMNFPTCYSFLLNSMTIPSFHPVLD